MNGDLKNKSVDQVSRSGAKVEYPSDITTRSGEVPSVRDENILRHLYGLRSKCELEAGKETYL